MSSPERGEVTGEKLRMSKPTEIRTGFLAKSDPPRFHPRADHWRQVWGITPEPKKRGGKSFSCNQSGTEGEMSRGGGLVFMCANSWTKSTNLAFGTQDRSLTQILGEEMKGGMSFLQATDTRTTEK